jgi:hypothetical protein
MRYSTNPGKCWVSFLNPTYTFLFFMQNLNPLNFVKEQYSSVKHFSLLFLLFLCVLGVLLCETLREGGSLKKLTLTKS